MLKCIMYCTMVPICNSNITGNIKYVMFSPILREIAASGT